MKNKGVEEVRRAGIGLHLSWLLLCYLCMILVINGKEVSAFQSESIRLGINQRDRLLHELLAEQDGEELLDEFVQLCDYGFTHYLDTDVELVYYEDWHEAKEGLLLNEVDVLLFDSQLDETYELIHSYPVFKGFLNIAYGERGYREINFYDNPMKFLRNKTIYIDKHLELTDLVKGLNLNSVIIEYDQVDEVIENAYLDDDVIIFDNRQLETVYGYQLNIEYIDIDIKGTLSFMTTLDNQELITKLNQFVMQDNKAFEAFKEKVLINRQASLVKKILFSEEERMWLESVDQIQVRIMDYMFPYVFIEPETHSLQGIAVEWINEFATIMHLPIVYEDLTQNGETVKMRIPQENEIFLQFQTPIETPLGLVPLYPVDDDTVIVTSVDEPLWQESYEVKIGVLQNSVSDVYLNQVADYHYLYYDCMDKMLEDFDKKALQGMAILRSSYYQLIRDKRYDLGVRETKVFRPEINIFYMREDSPLQTIFKQVSSQCINLFRLKNNWIAYMLDLDNEKNGVLIKRQINIQYMMGISLLMLLILILLWVGQHWYNVRINKLSKNLIEKNKVVGLLEEHLKKRFIVLDKNKKEIQYISPALAAHLDVTTVKDFLVNQEIVANPRLVKAIGVDQFNLLKDALAKLKEEGQVKVDIWHSQEACSEVKMCALNEGGLLITIEDITAQIQYQAQLEVALEAARLAEKSKSRFLAHISHEIRTPLHVMLGLSQIGVKKAEADRENKCKDYFYEIENVGYYLMEIIDDILEVEQMNLGKLKLRESKYALRQLLQDVRAMIEPKIQQKRQYLYEKIAFKDEVWIEADGIRIKQVMINLLTNASKYTQEEGEITLSVSIEKGEGQVMRILFSVADTGIGIDEKDYERIFDDFERVNQSNHDQKGVGLGLAISREIVTQMKGKLTVTSKLGEGSVFAGYVEVKEVASEKVGTCSATNQTPKKQVLKHVLFGDDDEINQMIIKEFLIDEPYHIDSCENGSVCLDKFLASPPGHYHILLMDIQMPIMDGYMATTCIRNSPHPDGKNIPIIAMSSNVFKEDLEAAQEVGMTDYLCKPIFREDLIKILEKY